MNLFPSGIAEGEAFCNRTVERKRLAEYTQDLTHAVIVAPRRYGKSSLIRAVVTENDLLYSWTDFLTVSSKKEVELKIGKAVAELLYTLAPDLKKLQLNFQKFFKSVNPDMVIQALGASLTLHPNFEKNIEIDEALMGLDQYAQELGKKAVVVFDEFQEISMLKEHKVIEALIRHAVERSRAITYIFSGSNRHLLVSMFGSSDRPLYRLCQTLTIERIAAKEYEKFLKKVVPISWKEKLSTEAFSTIMQLTERHPYYVNGLCRMLWRLPATPTTDDVTATWTEYVNTNRKSISSDISGLSLNQKRIISALAHTPTAAVFSKEFSNQTDLSTSSVKQVLEALTAKDIVYKDEEGLYKLLDPALRHFILTN
jgi:AAA+ ATPase superfamily predicted ATPase